MSEPQLVALTGATGFIGSHILDHLQRSGVHLRILVRQPHKHQFLSPNIDVIPGNLQDTEALEKLLKGCHALIHCAGRVKANYQHQFYEDNVLTSKLLFKLAKNIPSLKKTILISSLSARQAKLSHYAASKYAAEQCLIDSGIDEWTIIRPPAVYGPRDNELKPLFDWMRRGILWVPGSDKKRFSLLHVQDLCNVVIYSLKSEDSAHQILEPDDGKNNGYSWRDVQSIAEEFFNRKIILIKSPKTVLLTAANINLYTSRLLNRSAMLTPGKVQELLHENWVVNPEHIWPNWTPMIDFKNGLNTLYSGH